MLATPLLIHAISSTSGLTTGDQLKHAVVVAKTGILTIKKNVQRKAKII